MSMANLHHVSEQLKQYQPKLLGQKNTYPILAVELGKAEILHPDVLYIFDWQTQAAVVKRCLRQVCNIVVCGTDDDVPFLEASCHILLIHQSVHLPELALKIQSILTEEQRVAGYAQQMFAILASSEKLQKLVDYAYIILRNPVFVIDAGYRLIAANWEAKAEDNKSQRLMENRYLDPQDMQAINFDNIHQKVMNSDEPLLIKNPNYKFNRIIAGIKTGNKDAGHIVVVESENAFCVSDYQLVTVLRDVISQFFQKSEIVRNSRGYNYEYLITDLLDGNIVMSQQLNDRLSYVDFRFKDLLYIIVAELGRSRKYVNPTFVRERFEQLMPGGHSLLYNGQIALLVTRKKENIIRQEEIYEFQKYCKEMDLYCGMSNSFCNIVQLQQYYKQALRALELGTIENNEPSLYRYDEYALRHLTEQFTGQEAAKTFVHPVIRDLHEYDQKNDTELCYTLYVFLICERNIAATADFLHVHRNTVTYRLKKLDWLVNVDLDDWKTRQYLIASYPIFTKISLERE